MTSLFGVEPTVRMLKAELKEHGLSTKGVKDELLVRLQAARAARSEGLPQQLQESQQLLLFQDVANDMQRASEVDELSKGVRVSKEDVPKVEAKASHQEEEV
jgi:hypothetical protein